VAQDRLGLVYLDVQGFVRTIANRPDSDRRSGARGGSHSPARRQRRSARPAGPARRHCASERSSASGRRSRRRTAGPAADGRLGDRVRARLAGAGRRPTWARRSIAWRGTWTAAAGSPASARQAAPGSSSSSRRRLTCARKLLGWMGPVDRLFVGRPGPPSAEPRPARSSSRRPTRQEQASRCRRERSARQSTGHTKVNSLRETASTTVHGPGTTGPALHVRPPGDCFVVAVGGKDVLAQAISPSQRRLLAAFTAAEGQEWATACGPRFLPRLHAGDRSSRGFAGTDPPNFQKASPTSTLGAIVAGRQERGSGVTRSRSSRPLR